MYSRALQGIEANGKGILLLHDIQAKTVEALPDLLRELKRRGYHIVHVVPATPDQPKTATMPGQWIMHAHAHQQGRGSFVQVADTAVLPAPGPSSPGALDARPTASMQPHSRPALRPGPVPQPTAAARPRGNNGSQARQSGDRWRKFVRSLTAWM